MMGSDPLLKIFWKKEKMKGTADNGTLLEDGQGAGIVADILASENNPVWLSYISLGEIYYILLGRVSGEKAKGIIETILPGERISLVF